MKLKKIASLMLAGVMAVSMLAGCSGKDTNDNNGQENNGGQATGVSATFASYLSKDNVKFNDSSNNKSVLSKAVLEIDDSEIKGVTNVDMVDKNGNLAKAVGRVMVAEFTDGSGAVAWIKDNVTKKTTYYTIYKAPGDLDKDVVLEQVAADMDDLLASMPKNSLDEGEKLEQDAKYYTFDYTGSVSMTDVDTKNGADSAWFVMITLTVNPTEAKAPKA